MEPEPEDHGDLTMEAQNNARGGAEPNFDNLQAVQDVAPHVDTPSVSESDEEGSDDDRAEEEADEKKTGGRKLGSGNRGWRGINVLQGGRSSHNTKEDAFQHIQEVDLLLKLRKPTPRHSTIVSFIF